ncbi:hypothetical protein jhhlp_001854 [Lomentospora prolificans]|uniref:C2 domain-containing protein n=1 Tax=Lomentospora prolificans TaxID=41688 RepID=A0A2N3NCC5_9PEZI|nr:hypothetical protein jhhlp_001854 [Lomentospora prolificans]
MLRQEQMEDRAARRAYGGPYTAKHPVPTVQGYREHRAELRDRDGEQSYNQTAEDGEKDDEYDEYRPSKTRRAYESVKAIAKDEDQHRNGHDPYPTANRNWADRPQNAPEGQENRPAYDTANGEANGAANGAQKNEQRSHDENKDRSDQKGASSQSATEQAASAIDPMDKRKAMKKTKRHGGGREVTDPVTHLPITIHDLTDQDLKTAPENMHAAGSTERNTMNGSAKSPEQLRKDHEELERAHKGMRKMFPPPEQVALEKELRGVYEKAIMIGLGVVITSVATLAATASYMMRPSPSALAHAPTEEARGTWARISIWSWLLTGFVVPTTATILYLSVMQVSGWLGKRVESIFEDQAWTAAREEEELINESEVELPESVAWLNSLLASVWPLINPDLFTSLADTLEDVMQASLPKVIRMVSVDDIGQGSESIRILGVRWLPTGAAGQSVDSKGKIDRSQHEDKAEAGESQINKAENDSERGEGEAVDQDPITRGMEAEEGDFVNLELAFSYRARSSGKSIKSKAGNAHLYLKFYLPGGIAVPVWVELRGIVGIMRLRLQLTPDPPFFSLCTLTFLGQPRADLSCIPISKHSLNIMDVPLISNFVQSSIDAALAEYVAPKSLALDLKQMLIGDDFKKDTVALGVVIVFIKCAKGFKEGDGGIGPMDGSSDTYVTVSWGKFGKPAASTRIIIDTKEPIWNEWASIIVTPEELNAEETLRLQIWDSDKYTADDDLGRVELSLKDVMRASETKNRMCDREDGLRGDDPDEKMPGTLSWSVGYFAKTRIQQDQLKNQTAYPSIRSTQALKEWASESATRKLRESGSASDENSDERRQQTIQDFKEREDEMVIAAPPPTDLPSGLLSLQIHNITGLNIQKLNKREKRDDKGGEDETDDEDGLPDSYCTVYMNHTKIYRTRTKPKSAQPFFNAGTERFVRDWRTTEIIISVRDRREHENDPLLGIVYLPLRRVFEKRSQFMDSFPIAGGIGYGRVRISMVWRSVECRFPMELMGWEYGTLEVKAPVRFQGGYDKILGCKIHLHTKIARAKMKSHSSDGTWLPKRNDRDSVFLAVSKRYRTALVLEFRKSSAVAGDSTQALAVLWLRDIPDEEERVVSLDVWKAGKKQLEQARSSADYHGCEEGEQPVGKVEFTLKFWRGLSGYHKGYASKSRNAHVRDAMEVLDTVNGEGLAMEDQGDEYDDSDSDTSSDEIKAPQPLAGNEQGPDGSQETDAEKREMLRKANAESETDDDDPKNLPSRLKKRATLLISGDSNTKDDGSRGARAQLQDYKTHHKQLHRKHRGIMQWKATRTLDWMAGKVSRGKGKVGEVFEHGDKETGIETEV